jgi:hypothetical protein
VRARLEWPSAEATAWNVPEPPDDSEPAQAWDDAFRFHLTVTSWGTPCTKSTVPGFPLVSHADESHTIRPCLVTTTRTAPGPYGIWQPDDDVETA